MDSIIKGESYCIVDIHELDQCKQSFDTYQKASEVYHELNDSNLVIVYQGVIVEAKYALGIMDKTDCLTNVEYINDANNQSGYTNGCYGVDSVYIKTNSKGTHGLFKISGVNAWISFNDISLVPYPLYSGLVSFYSVKQGALVHSIATNSTSLNYGNQIVLDDAPSYLSEGETYYSYDGHYFYDDLESLFKDSILNEINHSINANQPYYNFFQYNNHLSLSNVTVNQLNDYISKYGSLNRMNHYEDLNGDSIHDNLFESLFYQNGSSFINVQDLYHTNALMMLAVSMNESGFGRSRLAYTRNNLFGHAAYDNAVEENASRYFNAYSSIASHANHYIQNSYCSLDSFTYHGCFFGNKASGMNVSYASDPYWGEKAAAYYYDMVKSLQLDEVNQNNYVIKFNEVTLYQDNELTQKLITINNSVQSFQLLQENDDNYKILLDSAITVNDSSIHEVYILKEENDIVHFNANPDIQGQNKILDANGGVFANGQQTIEYISFNEPTLMPTKEHAIFKHYETTDNIHYQAIYEDTVSLNVTRLPKIRYELNEVLDLTNGQVTLTYANGTTEIIDLTSDMITSYTTSKAGVNSVEIEYGGQKAYYLINVSAQLDQAYNQIKETLLATIEVGSATDQQLLDFKEFVDSSYATFPRLSISQVSQLSSILDKIFELKGISVVLEDTITSIGNLALALNLEEYSSQGLFHNQFKFNLIPINLEIANNPLIDQGYTPYQAYDFKIKHNFNEINHLQAPMLVSIDIDSSTIKGNLVAYSLANNQFKQLPSITSESSFTFLSDEAGSILIMDTNQPAQYSQQSYLGYFTASNTDNDQFNLTNLLIRCVIVAIVFALLLFWFILLICLNKKRGSHAYRKSNN